MKSSLKEILSTILCDVVAAQYEANEYSQNLADEYEALTGKKYGKIPQVKFSDVELELRFITEGMEAIEDPENSSIVVEIDAKTLASMPAECVQTLRLKVAPRTTEKGNE
jgi:hypothetical protein